MLGELKLTVCTAFGAHENLEPQYLWGPERTESCCLLDARLFPVFMPRSGPIGLKDVCWLLGGAGGLDSWREAWRLSLRDILVLTDQQTELHWREELFFNVGRRRAVDALQSHTDLSLLPFFRAAALAGQQEELLQVLDSVAAGSSGDLGVAARCLACIADVLGCLAGEGKGGLRSGPAANPSWAPAFKLLEDGNLPAVSGDDRSDSWSLGSSSYGSFRSRSGADTVFGSSRSRDSSHTSYESGAIKRYNSIEFPPPSMSGDERSDSWSVGSSAYSSFRSRSGADSSSVFSSSRSKVSSHSSGFGSLQSIPESVEHSGTKRAHGKPKISKLFPRLLQKRDKHEEDTKKT